LGLFGFSRQLEFVRAHGAEGLLRVSGSFGNGDARVRVDAVRHGFRDRPRSGCEEHDTAPALIMALC
jgi:hypothetical protein